MRIRSYLKEKPEVLYSEDLLKTESKQKFTFKISKSFFLKSLAIALLLPIAYVFNVHKISKQEIAYVDITKPALAMMPEAVTTTSRSVISIPVGIKKEHPFVPYRNISNTGISENDVPSALLVDPPEEMSESSDAARLMDTIVSGILYDKFSPSAILNIEGNDYLVKKGDVVNNYQVISILQDSVTVKLGNNTYKAGIGEILTEGTLNHNEVPNLNNKFGGGK